MSKATKIKKQALVPRLRFPEFRGAGDWNEKFLSNVCDMQSGKFIAAREISERPAEGLYPCFGGNGLRGYTKAFNKSGRYSLIGRQGALCGNINFIEGSFYATEHAVVTTPKPGVSTDWLFYLLDTLKLNRFATGQAQPGLSVEVLENVSCVIPRDEPEQQKIADCLSSLDALITAQVQKVDVLRTHKKGLMQQLFPREGETVPRLRFPEFRDAWEWDRTQLSTQVELISGLHLSPTEYSDSGETPYFTGPSDYSNELSTVRKWTARGENVGRSDDTLITVKGNGVGELLRLKLDEVAMGRQLMAVRPSIAHGGFIFYFLETRRQRLIELASGNLIPGLSRGDILSLEILVPEKQEQIKVANCLSAIDALITATMENLDALSAHKKGLMQQLFPNNQQTVGE